MSGFQENYFGVVDYILLGSTLLVSLLIGLYYGYKGKHTNEELLMGGRNMSVFPVAASVMVSYVSAITIIGFPSEIYAYGAQIFIYHAVSAVSITCSAFVLIPFFYEMKLTSVNEYLEKRFESPWIRCLASIIFITQNVLFSGVVLYAPSIALEAFLGFPRWMSIFGVGICATLYTNIGGIKAVVWTDAFQFLMMVTGVLAINWKGLMASGGLANSLTVSYEKGRMNFLDFTVDPFMRHNFWNLLIGAGLHAFMQPGVHQLQVQRYSGMPTLQKAKQAVAGSVPLKLTLISLSVITGFVIFGFYENCDPLSTGEIKKIDDIVPYFVVKELREIPGMMGIFTSCIFSATLSTLSSSLNSLAAVTFEDFLVRLKFFKSMTPRGQTNVSRMVGVMYGVLFIILAFLSQDIGAIYVASSAVIFSSAGALYGIFLMGMFLPFTNVVGAMAGGLSGFIMMLTISFVSYLYKTKTEMLPLSTEGCDFQQLINATTTMAISPVSDSPTSEWPMKIFTLSYLLYAPIATLFSIIIGLIVSQIAKAFFPQYRRKPSEAHIHPLVRRLFRSFIVQRSKDTANGGNYGGDDISPNGLHMRKFSNY